MSQPTTPTSGRGNVAVPRRNQRRPQVISLFLWLLRIPVPVMILLYLFNII